MNHLAHLFFSDPTPGCRLGALMGDYVKGRLDESYPPEIRRGMQQHRLLDRFAETNRHFRRSRQRLCPTFRHCRGIMVDVFYDHFLARNWQDYSPVRLESFAASIYRLLEERRSILPPALRKAVPRMVAADWLVACRETGPLDGVLRRLAARLSRPTPLEKGLEELLRHYRDLENDFSRFMIEATDFAAGLRRQRSSHGHSRPGSRPCASVRILE